MIEYPRSLHTKAAVWKALFPLRWLVSTQLWLVSWAARLISWAFCGLHVAIDYVRLMALDYTARPDDVFIVTYPRSGTTWLQMILYQLTTGGDMDFPHIAEQCPWFERVALNKRDLDKLPSPRVFKSHLPWIWIPKRRCRYIYVARNGKDVAVSFYHFYKSHFRYRGTFDQFFARFMRGWVVWGSWFYHVKGYWRHRNDANLLFLRYEDLIEDLEGGIRRIIAFLDLDVSEERIPQIVERCSFAFMKAHQEKFDFGFEMLLEQGMTPGTFIRKGQAGQWKACLSDQQRERFDSTCARSLGKLGLEFPSPSAGAEPSATRADGVGPSQHAPAARDCRAGAR